MARRQAEAHAAAQCHALARDDGHTAMYLEAAKAGAPMRGREWGERDEDLGKARAAPPSRRAPCPPPPRRRPVSLR